VVPAPPGYQRHCQPIRQRCLHVWTGHRSPAHLRRRHRLLARRRVCGWKVCLRWMDPRRTVQRSQPRARQSVSDFASHPRIHTPHWIVAELACGPGTRAHHEVWSRAILRVRPQHTSVASLWCVHERHSTVRSKSPSLVTVRCDNFCGLLFVDPVEDGVADPACRCCHQECVRLSKQQRVQLVGWGFDPGWGQVVPICEPDPGQVLPPRSLGCPVRRSATSQHRRPDGAVVI
jgi:hypothetical protein